MPDVESSDVTDGALPLPLEADEAASSLPERPPRCALPSRPAVGTVAMTMGNTRLHSEASTGGPLAHAGSSRRQSLWSGSPNEASALDAPAILDVQRSAGNAAVVSWLSALGGGVPLQRDEDEEVAPPAPGPQPGGVTWNPSDRWKDSYLRPGFQLRPPELLGAGTDPDWAHFSELFRNRGLVLGDGEAALIAEHWQRWLPLARALAGMPGVARFKSPADIMKSFTSSMIDSTLARDRPTAFERFNAEDEKSGISTRTLTLKEWRF